MPIFNIRFVYISRTNKILLTTFISVTLKNLTYLIIMRKYRHLSCSLVKLYTKSQKILCTDVWKNSKMTSILISQSRNVNSRRYSELSLHGICTLLKQYRCYIPSSSCYNFLCIIKYCTGHHVNSEI